MEKNKSLKRFFAFLLCAAMIITYMPSVAYTFADETSDDAAVVQEEPAPAPEKAAEPAAEPPAQEPAQEPAAEPVESAPAEEEPATPEVTETIPEEQAEEVATEEPAAEEPEEVEEVIEEEEPEEEKFPAFSHEETVDGMKVSVKAPEGALPEGASVSISKVAASEVEDAVKAKMGENAEVIKAVDITFFDKSGKEIEPKAKVSVKFTSKAISDADNPSVLHIAGSGRAEMAEGGNVSGSTASFKSADFSVYIVVDEEVPSPDLNAIATYEFYVGDELKASQNIKSGDSLLDPGTLGAGDGATSVFKGWYVDEGQDIQGETPGAKLEFGEKAEVPVTETIKVVAMLETTYYVTFRGEPDANGDRGIVAVDTVTVVGEAGTAGDLDISSRSVVPKADTSAFEGWSETEDGEVITETTISVDKSMELYAVIVDANWIHFSENVDWDTVDSEPTYTAPVYVKKTDSLADKKPEDPTRKGYKFGGWYEDSDCTQEFSWSGTGLESDMTLYAKWEPDETTYTVIIWKQKVTDAKDAEDSAKTYDYESSEQLTGTTGETLDPADFAGYTTHNYTGFHYGRTEIDPETVSADGSTVVNVYYDRNLLTIRFVDGSHQAYVPTSSNNGNQFGLIDGEYVSLTRENEGPFWNPDYHWYYQAQQEYTGTTYRQATGTAGTQYGVVNGQVVQLTYRNGAWYAGNQRFYGTRYFEEAQGNSGYGFVNGAMVGITHNDEGWHYAQSTEYTGQRYVVGTEPNVTEFTGLYGSTLESNGYEWPEERAWYQNPNGGGTRLTFLDAFKFEGLSGVSDGNTVLTQYGANITGTGNIRFYKQNIDGSWPANPTNTVRSSNGTFTITEKYEGFTAIQYRNGNGNWVNRGAGTSGISTNQLQIRFQRNKYELTFISDDEVIGTKTGIPYEDVLSGYQIEDPTKKHYRFAGWCEDPEGVAPVDWNSTMPAANKVVYAKWEPVQYHVTLDPNGGTIDESKQDSDFNVDVYTELSKDALFQSVSYDSRHELVGWFYKDGPKAGNVYDFGKIEEDVNLIAKWRMPGQVSIVYDAGEGGTNPPVDNYKYATDSSVVLGPPPEVNDGYVFVGWELVKDPGTIHYVNNTFEITEDLIEDYDEDTKTGIVNVKAVYNKADEGPFEKTYIRWFKNDGSECFHVDTLDDPAGDTADSTLLVNEPVGIQAAPERDGYEFIGWAKVEEADDIELEKDLGEGDVFIYYKDGTFYSDEACTKEATEVAADNDRKYEAMFAVWALEEYTVVYTDGVDGETVFEDEKHEGLTVEDDTPAFNGGTDPERDGYDFTGWDPAYQAKMEDAVADADDDNVITYVAQWAEKPKTKVSVSAEDSSVEKVYNGAEQSNPAVIDDLITIKVGDEEVSPDSLPEGVGYTVVPSGDAKGTNAGTYTQTLSLTLTAEGDYEVDGEATVTFSITLVITPAELTITAKDQTYIYNGETQGPGDETYTDPAEIAEAVTVSGLQGSDELTSVTVDGQGKEVGEYPITASNASLGDATENYTITYVEGKLTIDPEEEETADITYDLNGGEYNGSTADIVETYAIGEEITIHEAPTREGYKFVEWQGSSYQPGDSYTVTGDHTFTAIWVADSTDGDTPDRTTGINTGDQNGITGLLVLFGAALAGFLVIFFRRRRDQE